MFDKVTILAYYFRPLIEDADKFPLLEFALCETWKHCGLLKTVIVTDCVHLCVEKFKSKYSNVEIQVESSLMPGDIQSMSNDCNGRLYARFKTPYVLIVQDDGYPLRTGLEEFVGVYDFIGATYVRDIWWKNLICRVLGCWVQNGGFSLRSKKICEAAAMFWNKKYAVRLSCSKMAVEDLFYTQFLPVHEKLYRKSYRLATNRESLHFSWDCIVPILPPKELPFGFHRKSSLDFFKSSLLLDVNK